MIETVRVSVSTTKSVQLIFPSHEFMQQCDNDALAQAIAEWLSAECPYEAWVQVVKKLRKVQISE